MATQDVLSNKKMTNERAVHLLRKAIMTIENEYSLSIFDSDLADSIGITEDEYDELFCEVSNV